MHLLIANYLIGDPLYFIKMRYLRVLEVLGERVPIYATHLLDNNYFSEMNFKDFNKKWKELSINTYLPFNTKSIGKFELTLN